MSSSVTEAYEHNGKLLVNIAGNGHSFELDCNESTVVEEIMRFIESVSGINVNEQLVLCLDVRLESQRPLSAYKLPADDREVFIFSKASLQNNSPPLPLEQVDILDIADPPLPSSSYSNHPLDDASDPALKALLAYELQFRYHYQKGHVVYSRTQGKYENCERLLRQLRVQERALQVARGNLDQYYRMINQNYTDFMKRYSQQHRIHSDLLVNLGRDIEKLRSIKLHPTLQTATRKCLLDFVKEDNLRKLAENCSSSHRQFENKVAQFKHMFGEMKRKVEELFSTKAFFPIRNLELSVKEHQRYITEQRSIMQSLSKDVETVKKLVDDCLSCQFSSALRPHDAVSAVGPMYEVHDKNHLPKMQACDLAISKLLEISVDKKNEMNLFLHNYMLKIAYVSYIIKDAKLQFPVFKEAMVRQDDIFMDLKFVRGIGPAYRACLAEVVRRKASMKLYMGMAGQLAEKLARKREVEVQRREEFMKAHSQYIPRDVLSAMGLYDSPNPCDVHVAPFDTALIDIDIGDINHYAPEHLSGLSSRGERHGTLKSSYSNESAYSAEGDDISNYTFEKYGSEEVAESCELIEIAGTTKMEVENAKLKAELASAIALICSFFPEAGYESLDDSKLDNMLKNAAEKTAEALQLKDEYGKHLQSMLRMKQAQCVSYEKRIQELEQRLSDQYLQEQKVLNDKDLSTFDLLKKGDGEFKQGESPVYIAEPVDEASCISNSIHIKSVRRVREGVDEKSVRRVREGVDENMVDSSGDQNPNLDLQMFESNPDELLANDKPVNKIEMELGMLLTDSSTAESMRQPLVVLPCEIAEEPSLDSNIHRNLVLDLQAQLADKSNQLIETEAKLKGAMEELSLLTSELETSRKLLDESQMNCAHLENCLHEAREEAQTHLCAADRRASEYSAIRTSAVKLRGLFERLRTCIFAPGGVTGFSDSLESFAQSLANSSSDKDDDITLEFRKCIRILADKVSFLSKHRQELLEKYQKLETANEQLTNDLEEKKELARSLYTKHQLEKQANKEKISFGRLEVHEIAAFVRTAAGHYEAINRNCSNYYLSAESVALFADGHLNTPIYIVGQIVHIERKTVKQLQQTASSQPDHGRVDEKLPSNSPGSLSYPYGLPVGCEYLVVTVAMLPDTAIHSTSS